VGERAVGEFRPWGWPPEVESVVTGVIEELEGML
jgi:hypothetical protein